MAKFMSVLVLALTAALLTGSVTGALAASENADIVSGRRLLQTSCSGLPAWACQIVNSNTGSATAIANGYNGQSSFASATSTNTKGPANAVAISTSTTKPAPSPPKSKTGRRLLKGANE